jgi:CheY-like chemotaxis protein
MDMTRPRILIVEDDERTAAKYERALMGIGDSRTAEHAEEAYFQLIDYEPQVILLDIWLEGERKYEARSAGISILSKIREHNLPFTRIPVIVVTGLADPDVEKQCRDLGVVAFLQKPVAVESLRQAVKEALAEQHKQRRRTKVFISSAMEELKAERLTVKQAVQELGPPYDAELAEDWAARPEPPVAIWQRAARECDVFILVLGRTYGIPSPDTGISPTEDEYNQARAAGKPILVFRKQVSKSRCDPEMSAFLARLEDPNSGHLVKTFKTLPQLRSQVQRAVRAICVQAAVADSDSVPSPSPDESSQDSRPGATLTILFLAADPIDACRLRLGQEFREIRERLQLSTQRDRIKLELPQLSARPVDVSQALLDAQPQIVHFSGHGTAAGALCLESQAGTAQLVQPEALAALFEQFADQVDCVLLNACYTEEQARAIARHVSFVIGMSQAISDKAAIAFATGFYQALGAGRTVEEAYGLGCALIGLHSIPEHLTPVLVKKEQVQP